MSILVYSDQGVDGGSLHQLLGSLSHLPVKKVTAETLLNTSWEESTALLIIPGGRDLYYDAALKGEGARRIRAFVEKGGNYLGICAGGYFGAEAIEFEKGGALEVCGPRPLGFFPGLAIGPAFGPNRYCYQSAKGAEAARISWETTECSVFFDGGCFFYADRYPSHITPLARYLDIPDQPIAILSARHGKGLAILSGVHFEYCPTLLDPNDPHIAAILPKLHASNSLRLMLLKTILKMLYG